MLGIIGGSGLYELYGIASKRSVDEGNAYGQPSSPVVLASVDASAQESLYFIARHGVDHSIPPHKVNYRANIQALYDAGVSRILSVNAVGSCNASYGTGALLMPEQIIDYSYAREHTFFDTLASFANHIDFTLPFDKQWQERIQQAAKAAGQDIPIAGCYACTQGPRFETAAEVQRIMRDGGDIIGMTVMPEAALARERGIAYASLSMVVNMAAGLESDAIDHKDIDGVLSETTRLIDRIIAHL